MASAFFDENPGQEAHQQMYSNHQIAQGSSASLPFDEQARIIHRNVDNATGQKSHAINDDHRLADNLTTYTTTQLQVGSEGALQVEASRGRFAPENQFAEPRDAREAVGAPHVKP